MSGKFGELNQTVYIPRPAAAVGKRTAPSTTFLRISSLFKQLARLKEKLHCAESHIIVVKVKYVVNKHWVGTFSPKKLVWHNESFFIQKPRLPFQSYQLVVLYSGDLKKN